MVIGHGGRGIKAADALRHVFGYTIVNDVTARDPAAQAPAMDDRQGHRRLLPDGPGDPDGGRGADPKALRVITLCNGEKRQDATVADLIFDIPTLIEAISAGITLEPGDIIATGTPVGVGIGFTPPKFLQAGRCGAGRGAGDRGAGEPGRLTI